MKSGTNPPFVVPPDRAPKPAPKPHAVDPRAATHGIAVLRKILQRDRWDDQGGYSGRRDGVWNFVSTSLGRITPAELDALFALAGITPDEIDIVGSCEDCANAIDGRERGYSRPCVTCLRPSHINGFVPVADVKRRKR